MSKLFIFLLVALLFIPLYATNNFVVQTFPGPDGRLIDKITVPGIPVHLRNPGPIATPTRNAVMLSGVPAFDWSYGCSATSAAMISGYYDRRNFGHIYMGPTNSSVVPLNNSTWGTGECPLSATHQGYDGLATAGHVDRYWTGYNNSGDDPFGTGNPTGTYNGCTADYMGTNQDWWGNSDGSTTFTNYTNGSAYYNPPDGTTGPPYFRDGIHGFRLFLESRGYTVSVNYNQYIYGWNGNTLGYTYDNFKASIDAGIPVIIQIQGHSMVGVGYESTSNTIYIHNTWDYNLHTMTWGGIYSDMAHYGVGVIQLSPPPGISVSSNTLNADLEINAEGTDSLTITNIGTGPLTYNLTLADVRSNEDNSLFNLSVANADRSIAGSTLNLDASDYSPGIIANWTFSVYNGSNDTEWLKRVIVTFPTGVTVNSFTDFVGGAGGNLVSSSTTGNGVTIDWFGESGAWGVIYGGQTATATVNVTINTACEGALSLPYQIYGDIFGADPHTLTGNLILPQADPLLTWFNATPISSSIPAGQSQSVTGYFSSLGLTPGTYTAQLSLNSNDPYEPNKILNVVLNVQSNLATPVINDFVRTATGVKVIWNSVPNALHYKVYRSDNPFENFTLYDTTVLAEYEDSDTNTHLFYHIIASTEAPPGE